MSADYSLLSSRLLTPLLAVTFISQLLCVSNEALSAALVKRTNVINREKILVPLTREEVTLSL